MLPSLPTRIHVLILRDEIAAIGYQPIESEQPSELIPQDPRLRVTVAKAGYGEAVRAAQKHRPDVIVLDGVLGDPAGMVGELDEALQKTPVLVILDELERDRIHECVVAGARGCLIRPVDPNVLVQSIVQIHHRELRRRKQLEAELTAGERQGARLIAVRGVKGGVGATVVATNLAVALRRQTGRRVAVVDGHFFGGDVPIALNLVPGGSVADLVPHIHALDDDLLASIMLRHGSGVEVLAAPPELERAETIRSDELQRVVDALRQRYDYVVVDCAPFLDQNTLLLLDLAEVLLVVSTPELVSLKNAGRFLQLGTELGYPPTKLRLVINRLKSPYSVSKGDFERHLEYAMSYAIPNDSAVARTLLRGETLVADEPRSRAARAIQQLARVIDAGRGWVGEPAPSNGRRLFGRPRLKMLPGPSVVGSGPEGV